MFLLHFYILKLIVNILTRATLVVAKKPTNKGFRPIPLKFLKLVFNPIAAIETVNAIFPEVSIIFIKPAQEDSLKKPKARPLN